MTSSGTGSNVGSSEMPGAGQQMRNVSGSSDEEKKEGEFLKPNLHDSYSDLSLVRCRTYPSRERVPGSPASLHSSW